MNLAMADQDTEFCYADTYATLYTKLMRLPNNRPAVFYMLEAAARTLSNDNITASYKGVVVRMSGNAFDFFGTMGNGAYLFHERVTLGESSVTIDKISSVPLSANKLCKTVPYTYTYSLAANTTLNITANDFGISAPSGYTAVAVRYFSSGSGSVMVRTASAGSTGTNTAMSVRNVTGTAVSDAIAYLTVLYMRSDSVTIT